MVQDADDRHHRSGLGLLAAGLLGLSLLGVGILLRWRARAGAGMESGTEDPQGPIGGGIFAGLSRIARSPYLLGISAFVVLLATASTFLYFEQARLVAETFPDRVRQTQVFSALDAVVQALTISRRSSSPAVWPRVVALPYC